MPPNETTREKVVTAALDLFFAQGIKKTSLAQVAFQAGVTRITVYRYFPDKQQLVLAALMRIPAALEAAQARLPGGPIQDVGAVLDRVGAAFAAFPLRGTQRGMPSGDLSRLLDELQRVYPPVWEEVQTARLAAIQAIFNRLFALAETQGRLRPGLNRQVVQAYFVAAVVAVFEDPARLSTEFSPAEVFETVKAIFLHGILKKK
jgi:AcrR family transcriptional regulator